MESKINLEGQSLYNISNELFTPAKFNNNTNCKEMMIISSLGQYVILWNFKQVQNGQTDSYRIINTNKFVIDNTIPFEWYANCLLDCLKKIGLILYMIGHTSLNLLPKILS